MDGNLVGGGLVVAASIVSNLGTNVQKRSHDLEAERPEAEQRGYVQRKLWWLGMGGVIFGSVADFLALGFASQSLVAALGGATTLISNTVVAHCWNREAVYKSDAAGVLCVVVGAVIFALTAEDSEDYTLDELEGFFLRSRFISYILVQISIIMLLLGTIYDSWAYRWRTKFTESMMRPLVNRMSDMELKMQQKIDALHERIRLLEYADRERNGHASPPPASPRGSPSVPTFTLGPAAVSQIASTPDESGGERFRHWSDQYVYAGSSGAIGALSVLFGGCVSKVLVESIQGENQFVRATPILFVIGMVVCVLTQTHLLNRAMMVGDNMSVVPMFIAFWTFFGVVGGVVFYRQGSVNLIGLVFMVFGVLLLMQHESKREDTAAGAPRDDIMFEYNELHRGVSMYDVYDTQPGISGLTHDASDNVLMSQLPIRDIEVQSNEPQEAQIPNDSDTNAHSHV